MPPVKPCPLDLLLASTNWPSLNQLGPNSALTGSKPSSLLTLNSTTDRKSTRLNSSHSQISYADFCLTKNAFEMRLVRVVSGQYLLLGLRPRWLRPLSERHRHETIVLREETVNRSG